jgi:Arc/MetJ-type ribon-helix-helix transcriptional regulator
VKCPHDDTLPHDYVATQTSHPQNQQCVTMITMPKKEKKRLQVVISDEQDALLTKAAYELSSPERLVSKSEVVRLAIEKISAELKDSSALEPLLKMLEEEEAQLD